MDELKNKFVNHVKSLQEEIIHSMTKLDSSLNIKRDEWTRKDVKGDPGGGGLTCALTGDIFENAE